MKKIFVDTNIISDLLPDREPFSKFAINLFKQAVDKKIVLFTSSHSIATTYYLLKKYLDEATLRQVIINLLEYITLIPVDLDHLIKALSSKHKDLEDVIQIYCAGSVEKMDCMITRNMKDFKNSEIPAFAPEEFGLS